MPAREAAVPDNSDTCICTTYSSSMSYVCSGVRPLGLAWEGALGRGLARGECRMGRVLT